MKPWLLLLIPLLVLRVAAEEPLFSDPDDAAVWEWFLKRSDRKPHVERDRNGKLKFVAFYDEEKKKADYYTGSFSFDDQGRVVKVTCNKVYLANDDFKELARLKHLETLTAWHNGWDKERDENLFDGSGLIHLKDGKLAAFNIGGSWFNDAGMKAANQLNALRELTVYHTRVTNAGVKALRGNTALTYLNLGPQFSQKVSAACLEDVATMKHLEILDLNEMLLPWDDGLEHLVKLKPTLKKLTCKQSHISAEDLAKLKRALPGLDVIHEPATAEQVEKMKKRAAADRRFEARG